MAVTHFQITELPDPSLVISKIGGSDIFINTLYDISRETEMKFSKRPEVGDVDLEVELKYQAYDIVNDVWGNIAPAYLKWLKSVVIRPPYSSSVYVEGVLGDIFNLVDVIFLSESVEFVEVIDIEGANFYFINGSRVMPGHTVIKHDFLQMTFKINNANNRVPYSKMIYKVGNSEVTPDTLYSITVYTIPEVDPYS